LPISLGSWWRYFKGVREPSPDPFTGLPTTAWTRIEFDDSAWLTGRTGIGFGDNDDETVLKDMQYAYLSVYARKRFWVPDPSEVRGLALRIDWDDGFVAYLNGEEIARSGLTRAPPRFTDAASEPREVGEPETFIIDPRRLVSGTNIVSIQVHNVSLSSSDLSLAPELITSPDVCSLLGAIDGTFDIRSRSVRLAWQPQLTWESVAVRREGVVLVQDLDPQLGFYVDPEPPIGADLEYTLEVRVAGETCLLQSVVYTIPPEAFLLEDGAGWRFRRGHDAPPATWTDAEFDDSAWEFGPTPIGYGDGDDRTVLADMQEILGKQRGYLTVFLRRAVEIPDPDAQSLILRVRYDDGAVVWVNGNEYRRLNVDPTAAITHETSALEVSDELAFADLEISKEVLRPGRNVFAVSVHNVSATSSDLTFTAWIWARGDDPVTPESAFRRGDVDDDGSAGLSDAITLLDYLFRAGPSPACLDAADVDDSGRLDLSDAIALLRWLFVGDAPPPPPSLDCGMDPTSDELPLCRSSSC